MLIKQFILAEATTERERPRKGFELIQLQSKCNSGPQRMCPKSHVSLFLTGTPVPLTRWKGVPYIRKSYEFSRDGCISP